MTDHQPSHANPTPDGGPPSTSAPRSRRALVAAGATAAVGVVGVAIARPADAAAGQALILGRSNTSGSAATIVSSSATGSAFWVKGTAGNAVLGDCSINTRWGVYARNLATTANTGGGVRAEGRLNHGILGDTTNPNKFGVIGVNRTASAGGDGGAVFADGGLGAGLFARTRAPDTAPAPAVWAEGGAGLWAGFFSGDVLVDGTVAAMFVVTSVNAPSDPAGFAFADVMTGADAYHTAVGRATLSATGTATVTAPAGFTGAATIASASVQLTAMAAQMPNLNATLTATGFTIAGGAASGEVSWTLSAPRKNLGTAAVAAAGVARTSTATKTFTTRRETTAKARPSS